MIGGVSTLVLIIIAGLIITINKNRDKNLEDTESKPVIGPPISGPPITTQHNTNYTLQPTINETSPPLPGTGLPQGWTMEQWEYYGQQYLEMTNRQ